MTLDCIVCGKKLEPTFCDPLPGPVSNQPSEATYFISYGQYGSTIFDPMDGQFIEINICDVCLAAKRGERQNVIALGRSHVNIRDETQRHPPIVGQRKLDINEVPDIVPWHGQEHER